MSILKCSQPIPPIQKLEPFPCWQSTLLGPPLSLIPTDQGFLQGGSIIYTFLPPATPSIAFLCTRGTGPLHSQTHPDRAVEYLLQRHTGLKTIWHSSRCPHQRGWHCPRSGVQHSGLGPSLPEIEDSPRNHRSGEPLLADSAGRWGHSPSAAGTKIRHEPWRGFPAPHTRSVDCLVHSPQTTEAGTEKAGRPLRHLKGQRG